jgi:DNA-binding NarL/FixJ family response regulator
VAGFYADPASLYGESSPITEAITMRPEDLRVVVADDEAIARIGLASILSEAGIDVVSTAADGNQALTALREFSPDVALLDVVMPGLDGIEVTRLMASQDSIRCLLISKHDDDERLLTAVSAGAWGFLTKDAATDEVAAGVTSVAAGHCVWSKPAFLRLQEMFKQRITPGLAYLSDLNALTSREIDVMRLVVDGRTNHEISQELVISITTVKTHVSNILAKLHVRRRSQIVSLVAPIIGTGE